MRFYIILGLAAMAMAAVTGERTGSDVAPPQSLNTTTAVNGTTTDDTFDDVPPVDDDNPDDEIPGVDPPGDDSPDDGTPGDDTPGDVTTSEAASPKFTCYLVGTPPNCTGDCRAGDREILRFRCGGPGGCCTTGDKKLCCSPQ